MVIVGAGSSTRFGADKLLTEVAGRPLIEHTIEAVRPHVDVCVVVCRPEVAERLTRSDLTVVPGGPTRTRSEMAGVAALGSDVDLVGIHDAARPLVSPALLHRLFEVAAIEGGALPMVAAEGLIIDRTTHLPVTGVHGAQTPQVFRGTELFSAYRQAAADDFEGHDTVDVMQRYYPGDLKRVEGRLSAASRT
jgi:2-C-methyl-D-erythritol 4-phosphate cytidylyltransferase